MTDYVHRISDEERERIRRFVRMGAAITVLFVALVFVAVLTARHWVTLISPDSERQFVRPHVAWLHRHILDESDPVLQDYVAGLGAELAADMGVRDDMELEFLVIEGSTINAFTTLGGYIFVFDGLVRELDGENGLAMVLAHEIAHAINRDPLTAASRGILIQVLLSALSGNRGVDPASAGELGSELMLGIYSREQEEEADQVAMEALYRRYGGTSAVQLNCSRRWSITTAKTTCRRSSRHTPTRAIASTRCAVTPMSMVGMPSRRTPTRKKFGISSVRRLDDVPVAVSKAAGDDDDEVHQRPDAEATESQQLQYSGADLADVETVDAEGAEEKAQQDRRDESLVANRPVIHKCLPFSAFAPDTSRACRDRPGTYRSAT
jgi:predicted Zn-dependent protease